jgi:hypothetical protein
MLAVVRFSLNGVNFVNTVKCIQKNTSVLLVTECLTARAIFGNIKLLMTLIVKHSVVHTKAVQEYSLGLVCVV